MISNNISSKAMLIHHHQQTGQVNVTSHDVLAVQGGKGFTLGAGRAFSDHDKRALVELLLNEHSQIEYVPNNLVVRGRGCLVWYVAPQLIDIPFPDKTIKAPLPGLIFCAFEGMPLRCYAFKGNNRPEASTPLFYAPLGNVYEDGDFCTGNVKLPEEVLVQNIPTWERFVLESTNTHIGTVNPIKGCENFQGMIAFYQQLAESKARRFPAKSLVPFRHRGAHLTLDTVVQESQQ
ncbi:TPA: PRTRC system protein B [Pseudomonas aeruginosa]